jgi:hypothetical protein
MLSYNTYCEWKIAMINNWKRFFLGGALLLLVSPLTAQIERQHQAHVHGLAEGNLVLDGWQLRLELEIPGANLVGFEHPPRSDEQRDHLAATLALLEAGDWLRSDDRGQCQLQSMSAHTHGYGTSDDHDESDPAESKPERHDHGHHHHNHHDDSDDQHGHRDGHVHQHDHEHGNGNDHGHDHDPGHDHNHDHAEFHLVAVLECQSPERLRWVDIGLFDDFPGNESIRLDVLTDQLVTRLRLHSGAERVDLRARR